MDAFSGEKLTFLKRAMKKYFVVRRWVGAGTNFTQAGKSKHLKGRSGPTLVGWLHRSLAQ